MQSSPSAMEIRRGLIQNVLDGSLRLRSSEPPLVASFTGGSAPLSSWQMHIWQQDQVASRLAPGASVFNETITVYRQGTLDIAALERSLDEILRRHQSWRTVFPVVDGKPLQAINPACGIHLSKVDLRNLEKPDRDRERLRLASEEVRRPFDLEQGPLVRTTLFRLDDEEWQLLLTVHQILLDGVSVYHVFLPELMTLYKAFHDGQPSPLTELPLQYADYAIWQQERSRGNALSAQMAYWRKQLAAPIEELRLPADRPRPARQTFRGAILPFTLPRQLSEDARSYSQGENVTLFNVLLAAFYSLLQRYTSQGDIVVGTIAPTRPRSELQNMLGYFLNPVVLRADLTGNPTFRETLVQSRNVFLEAISHSEAPFDAVGEMLRVSPPLDRQALYQVQISLEPPLPTLDAGWNLTPMDFESGGAKLDLYLVFDDRPQGIMGRVQYNPDLFDAATMARLVEHYQSVLQAVVANPLLRVSELPQFTLTEPSSFLAAI